MISCRLKRAIEEAVRRKGIFELEHRVRRADGTLGWTLSRAIPVLDSGGEIQEWFGAASDVTNRRMTEENLRRSNAELARINKELEEFAYVASHDLQEPLRMVNLYTQLLLRRVMTDDKDAQAYSAYIHKGVERMHLLVRDLLQFSQAVHEDSLPVAGKAELAESLDEALVVLRDRVEENGATVWAEVLPAVRGETKQFAHVFQNLISNALKYRRTEVAPAIGIGAWRGDGEWVISVSDNGIGFEQQYAQRIFGLFKRLHSDEYPGTGLGLAICQRIVSRYGGRMWAEGRPGEGATFFFAVPEAVPHCGNVGSVS